MTVKVQGDFKKEKKNLELQPLIKRVRMDSSFAKISELPTDTEVPLHVVILSLAKTSQRSGIFAYNESKTPQICSCNLEILLSMTTSDLMVHCC